MLGKYSNAKIEENLYVKKSLIPECYRIKNNVYGAPGIMNI